MPISTGVPESQLIPLYWVNVDGSMAGNLTQEEPALLVGQGASTGQTATPNVPYAINTLAFAQSLFVVGSMIERMVYAFLNNNTTQLFYAMAVPDPSAGIAATGSVQITAGSSAGGLYTLYVAGYIVQIVVQSTDSTSTIATNLAAAINAMTVLPVTASPTTSTVNLTCKWEGLTGNDITLLENYGGTLAGQSQPVGMTTTVTPMASGAGAPTFTTAIANIAPGNYTNVALPFTDTVSLGVWNTEYGFGPTGRWNYIRQQYGWIYSAHRSANFSAAVSYGMTNNSPVLSIMEIEARTPSPVWEVAAAYCARGAAAFLDDPARPLQTLELFGIVVANLADRYSLQTINNLTGVGLAVQTVDANGLMMIMREATTYQVNSFGQADTAFSLLTVLSTLAELLERQRSAITSKFPRYKLAPDGTRFGAGQAIVTPTIIKGELIAEGIHDEFDGLVADVSNGIFAQNLIVELDDDNPNRVNVLYPPRLIGQLRIFAVLAQFRLLLPQDTGIAA